MGLRYKAGLSIINTRADVFLFSTTCNQVTQFVDNFSSNYQLSCATEKLWGKFLFTRRLCLRFYSPGSKRRYSHSHFVSLGQYTALGGTPGSRDPHAGLHSKQMCVVHPRNGSAIGGTTAGSAGMVATVGDPADPVITHTSRIRGAELTSSYREEKTVLFLAPGWASGRIAICSDSQPLLKAIRNGAHDAQSIRQRLDNMG